MDIDYSGGFQLAIEATTKFSKTATIKVKSKYRIIRHYAIHFLYHSRYTMIFYCLFQFSMLSATQMHDVFLTSYKFILTKDISKVMAIIMMNIHVL